MTSFTLGGDPEFAAIEPDQDWWFDAITNEIRLNGSKDELLLNIPPGYKQLPLIDTGIFAPVGERSDPSLPIGQDGHPDIGELRLPPSENPDEFIENTRVMIAQLHDYFAPYEEKTRKDVYLVGGPAVLDDPLGGHIHALASSSKSVCDALVMCLNLVYVPLVLVGYAPGERFRRNYIKPGAQDPHPYGQLGDARFGWMRARHRPHWDEAAMDWRVLSSYISHPELTGAVAALHYMVIDAFHKKEVPDLPVNILFDSKLEEAFNNVDRSYLLKKLPRFLAYWRKFPLYEDSKLQKLLQPLMQCFQVSNIFYPWVDVRVTWGIIDDKPALAFPRNELTEEESKAVENRPKAVPLFKFVVSTSETSNPLFYYLQDRHRAVRRPRTMKGLLLYRREDGLRAVETNNPEFAEILNDTLLVDYIRDGEASFSLANDYARNGFWIIGLPKYFDEEEVVYNAMTRMEAVTWL